MTHFCTFTFIFTVCVYTEKLSTPTQYAEQTVYCTDAESLLRTPTGVTLVFIIKFTKENKTETFQNENVKPSQSQKHEAGDSFYSELEIH